MSRWQPPHPAKTITQVHPRIDDTKPPIKWSATCCWPGCHGMKRMYPEVPLCANHTIEVSRVSREYTARSMSMLMARRDERERLEEEAREAAIQKTRRLPSSDTYDAGIVYYILVGVHIKIGFTTNMNRRVRAYPPDSNVLGVERGSRELERERHKQFEAHRSLGREWFVDDESIRKHIEDVCLQWSPEHRAAVGPSGPRRGQIKLRNRGGQGWKVA